MTARPFNKPNSEKRANRKHYNGSDLSPSLEVNSNNYHGFRSPRARPSQGNIAPKEIVRPASHEPKAGPSAFKKSVGFVEETLTRGKELERRGFGIQEHIQDPRDRHYEGYQKGALGNQHQHPDGFLTELYEYISVLDSTLPDEGETGRDEKAKAEIGKWNQNDFEVEDTSFVNSTGQWGKFINLKSLERWLRTEKSASANPKISGPCIDLPELDSIEHNTLATPEKPRKDPVPEDGSATRERTPSDNGRPSESSDSLLSLTESTLSKKIHIDQLTSEQDQKEGHISIRRMDKTIQGLEDPPILKENIITVPRDIVPNTSPFSKPLDGMVKDGEAVAKTASPEAHFHSKQHNPDQTSITFEDGNNGISKNNVRRSSLRSSLSRPTEWKRYSAPQPNQPASSVGDSTVHQENKSFPCKSCHKVFSREIHLSRHERYRHMVQKPYVCEHSSCHKEFRHLLHYRIHIRSHSGEKSHGLKAPKDFYRKDSEVKSSKERELDFDSMPFSPRTRYGSSQLPAHYEFSASPSPRFTEWDRRRQARHSEWYSGDSRAYGKWTKVPKRPSAFRPYGHFEMWKPKPIVSIRLAYKKDKDKDDPQTNNYPKLKPLHPSYQLEECYKPLPNPRGLSRRSVKRSKETQLRCDLGGSIEDYPEDKSDHEKELDDTQFGKKIDSYLMGEEKIAAWKSGAGRSKDWRSSVYTKATTKRQLIAQISGSRRMEMEVRFLKVPETPIPDVFNPFLPAVTFKSHQPSRSTSLSTVVFLDRLGLPEKRSKGTRTSFQTPLPGSPDPEPENTHEQRQDITVLNSLEVYRYQAETRQTYLSTTSSSHPAPPITLHHLGAILVSPYGLLQLQSHIHTFPHFSAYILRDLNTGLQYEAKIYTLRGLHPKQRKRRVENLKIATDAPSFLYSFDFEGKKYCVFVPSEPETENRMTKLGVVGRRNGLKFDAMFPELPRGEMVVESTKDTQKITNSLVNIDTCTASATPDLPQTLNTQVIDKTQVLSKSWPQIPVECKEVTGLTKSLNMPTKEEMPDAPADEETFDILIEEVAVGAETAARWSMFPKPLPLATRLLIRLSKRHPGWKKDVAHLLPQEAQTTEPENVETLKKDVVHITPQESQLTRLENIGPLNNVTHLLLQEAQTIGPETESVKSLKKSRRGRKNRTKMEAAGLTHAVIAS